MNDPPPAAGIRELWPLLFPAAYLLHIVEEVFGGAGFVEWTLRFISGGLTESSFAIINGVAWPAMLFATLLGIRNPSVRWFLVAIATILLVNGVLHIGSSLVTATYSPGTITAVLLYLPITVCGMRRLVREVPRGGVRTGLIVGLALHLLVFFVAFGGPRA